MALPRAHAAVPDGVSDADRGYHALSVFADALHAIRTQHLSPPSVDTLIEGAIRGMTDTLDTYTTYLTAEQFSILQEDTEGSYQGIGVLLHTDADGIFIQEVLPGSPAEKQGLQVGDRLVQINGDTVSNHSLREIFTTIRTSDLKTITLRIQRDEHLVDIEVARRRIDTEPLRVVTRPDGSLYLRLNAFSYNVHKDVQRAIRLYMRKNKENPRIILDLRDNPGGLFDEAIATARLFLTHGIIVQVDGGPDGRHDAWRADEASSVYDGPLVIWINQHSASSAEILSAALQDNQRATIMGQQSYGKGTVQQLVPLANGGALKITVTEYRSPLGHAIHHHGVTPDVLIPQQEDQSEDAKWFKASDLIWRAIP